MVCVENFYCAKANGPASEADALGFGLLSCHSLADSLILFLRNGKNFSVSSYGLQVESDHLL